MENSCHQTKYLISYGMSFEVGYPDAGNNLLHLKAQFIYIVIIQLSFITGITLSLSSNCNTTQ